MVKGRSLCTEADSAESQIDFNSLLQKRALEFGFLENEVRHLTSIYYRFFKPTLESIPVCLASLIKGTIQGQPEFVQDSLDGILEFYEVEGFIEYNWNENFLKERQFAITEHDPLFMKNFNPKRSNDLNIELQKAKTEEKQLKKKSKDEFRREVKQIREKQLQKQNQDIKKGLQLQKVKTQKLLEFGAEKKRK